MRAMQSTVVATLGLALLLAVAGARAQTAAAASAPAATSAVKPKAHVTVIEDDGVRIEESRSNGRVQRITVQSKLGKVRAYEIGVAPAGRDPEQEKGNAGRRAWSVLSF
jgi:hypothetical protein